MQLEIVITKRENVSSVSTTQQASIVKNAYLVSKSKNIYSIKDIKEKERYLSYKKYSKDYIYYK